MPYNVSWSSESGNHTLATYPDVLEGYTIVASTPAGLYPIAYRLQRNGHITTFDYMYFCHYCNGWLIGSPSHHYHGTLTEEGAKIVEGVSYHCIRCGNLIGKLDY